MILLVLVLLGLCMGSFINALVWRLHLTLKTRSKKSKDPKLSIVKGHSMCPNCRHQLAAKDLIPVISWLMLSGKCRYCHKSISVQYPFVEVLTAFMFVFSYNYWSWPLLSRTIDFSSQAGILFGFWLIFLVGLIALAVYDIKWFILPDKIVYGLMIIALIQSILIVVTFGGDSVALREIAVSFAIGGGLFYLLYQISNGTWIGGGDVKLGGLLGLILANPSLSLMTIFLASLIGSIITLPLMGLHKINKSSHIPFGPLLIIGAIIARLFGASIVEWYKRRLMLY